MHTAATTPHAARNSLRCRSLRRKSYEVYETYQALKQQPDPQKARSKKKDKRAKTEQVRISHASKEDLDKKAKKLLRRRDLQRRLFLAACGVVAAVCIGYD